MLIFHLKIILKIKKDKTIEFQLTNGLNTLTYEQKIKLNSINQLSIYNKQVKSVNLLNNFNTVGTISFLL